MSKKKNQHYVPQFYLRNFSKNRKSLNLFNITTGKIIIGDSIKNQCSEDYFYGKTYPIEDAFSQIESFTGTILKRMIDNYYIPEAKTQDHTLLLLFIVTLHSRTKYKVEEMNEMMDKMAKSILEMHPDVDKEFLNKVKIQLDFPLHYAILNSFTRYQLIGDLSLHLFKNDSQDSFITSDHPVVLYNKWAEDIKEYGSIGLASKGLLIFFPLSPHTLLLLYDNSVYKIGNKKDSIAVINDSQEVNNINLLQWLKCQDNIYFYGDDEQDKILREARTAVSLRHQSKTTYTQRSGPNGSKVFSSISTKLRIKLKVNSIKIRKRSKQLSIEDKILAVRNKNLLEMVDEFSDLVKLKRYKATDWNIFLEDKLKQS